MHLVLYFEIVAATSASKAAGATIADIGRRAAGSFMAVAIERADGGTVVQPPLSTGIAAR